MKRLHSVVAFVERLCTARPLLKVAPFLASFTIMMMDLPGWQEMIAKQWAVRCATGKWLMNKQSKGTELWSLATTTAPLRCLTARIVTAALPVKALACCSSGTMVVPPVIELIVIVI